MSPYRSQIAEAVHRLKQLIDKLGQEQIETLKTARLVGMTTDESNRCEQRRKLMLKLVCELALLVE